MQSSVQFLYLGMRLYFFLTVMLFSKSLFSQETFQFSKKYQLEEEGIRFGTVKTIRNKNNFQVVTTGRFPDEQIPFIGDTYLFDINKNTGLLNYGKRINIPGDTIGFRKFYIHENLDDDEYYLLSHRVTYYETNLSHKTILCGNANDIIWGKRLPYNNPPNLKLIKKDEKISLMYDNDADSLQSLEALQLDLEGNIIRRHSIRTGGTNPTLNPLAIDIDTNNDRMVIGGKFNSFGVLFSVSSDNLLNYKIFKKLRIFDLKVLTNGEIILFGGTQNSTLGGTLDISEGYFHLMKFSPDLEVIWAKTIYTSPNSSFLMQGTLDLDDNIFVTISSLDAKIHYNLLYDSDGDLIQKRGVPFGFESVLNEDGSTYISNNLSYSQSLNINEFVVAKTDENYQLEQCETYDGCITEGSYDYEFFDFELVLEESTDTLIPFEFTSEPFSLTVEDYCETIPPPLADFVTPDTLCRNACFIPTETFNETSEAIEWQLTGIGIDTTFSDFSTPFCLEKAGTYQLMQTVWFFGCAESYMRTIEVLPDLDIYFEVDTFLCQSPPFTLPLASNRALTQITWQDDTQSSDYQVLNDGLYAVTATDDYCRDSMEITLEFAFLPDFTPEFSVGRDTVICLSGTLPITIRPESNFTDLFTLDGLTDSVFMIERAGEYLFSAQTDADCIFYESLQVEAVDCRPDIYLPTAFSPNFDGVNDKWQALGVGFELLELTVFDRWGSLLLRDTSAAASWDGSWRGEMLPQGVYVVVLRYRNTKTGEEGVVSGDISLLR